MKGELRVVGSASAVLGTFALGAFGMIAWMAVVRNRSLRPAEGSPRGSPGREMRVLGKDALGRGDLTEAERRFEGALALDPGSAAARLELGRIRLLHGDRRGAWPLYRELVEMRPPQGGADALAWYADLGAEFGRVAIGQRLRRTTARFAEARTASGARLLALAHVAGSMGLGRADRAASVGHLRRAIAIDPGLLRARIALATSLEDRVEGVTVLNGARTRAKNSDSWAWARIAQAYDRLGRPDRAVGMARGAGRAAAETWCALAESASGRDDRPLAKERYDTARALAQAGQASLWCRLARGYDTMGETALASAMADRARAVVRPRDVDLRLNLSVVLRDVGREAESRGLLQEAQPFADERQRDWIRARMAVADPRQGPSWPPPAGAGPLSEP